MSNHVGAFSVSAIPLRWLVFLPGVAFLIVPVFGFLLLGAWVGEAEKDLQLRLQNQANTSANLLQESQSIITLLEQSPLPELYLQSIPIENNLQLDGRQDDWPEHEPRTFGIEYLLELNASYLPDSLSYNLSVGASERYLYLFYQVIDDHVVYREFNNPSVHRNDHIRLGTIDAAGNYRRYTIANFQPGKTTAHVIAGSGRALREIEEISGSWRATEAGYNVEIRISRDLLSERFSTTVVDVDDPDERNILFIMGLAETTSATSLGWIGYPEIKLRRIMNALPLSGFRLTDSRGRLIFGKRNSPFPGDEVLASDRGLLPAVFDRRTYHASAPIVYRGKEIGTISLSAGNSEIIALVQHLLRKSVLPIGLLLVFTILSGLFAAKVISMRLNRLHSHFDAVITSAGRITEQIPMIAGGDAINKLDRGLTRLINRVEQYNDYLEQMASRLSHELRTPISVVRSSLDNLNQAGLSEQQLVYLERAFTGVERLSTILVKMSEARRLEESLDENEVIIFDLAALVRGCMQGYESAYEDQAFQLNIESEEIKITGIPDLLAQLLDKLISNAVEFSEDGQPVIVRLTRDDDEAVLRVINAGVELPADMESQLFDSLVSSRSADHHSAHSKDADNASHLGLGLYIARIITDFHGGRIRAANREDVKGVVVTVVLPIMRITTRLL